LDLKLSNAAQSLFATDTALMINANDVLVGLQ